MSNVERPFTMALLTPEKRVEMNRLSFMREGREVERQSQKSAFEHQSRQLSLEEMARRLYLVENSLRQTRAHTVRILKLFSILFMILLLLYSFSLYKLTETERKIEQLMQEEKSEYDSG